MSKLILYIFFVITGCASNNISIIEQLQIKYDKAQELYQKGKYSRVKEDLQYIIVSNPGSKMALESQFLLGESYFKLGEFELAAIELDKYARFFPPQDVDAAAYKNHAS